MKKILLVFISVLSLFLVTGCGSESAGSNVSKNPDLKAIMDATSLNEQQAISVVQVLSGCEVKDIKEIKYDSTLDNVLGEGVKGYRMKMTSVKNITLYIKNGEVFYLGASLGGEVQELYSNNQIKGKISEYTLTMNEMTDYQLRCQRGVTSMLKSPKTAEFPNIDEWAFSKNKERIIVQSYVDSQNGFGALLRTKFQVTFSPDGKNVTSLIFDGKEYMK